MGGSSAELILRRSWTASTAIPLGKFAVAGINYGHYQRIAILFLSRRVVSPSLTRRIASPTRKVGIGAAATPFRSALSTAALCHRNELLHGYLSCFGCSRHLTYLCGRASVAISTTSTGTVAWLQIYSQYVPSCEMDASPHVRRSDGAKGEFRRPTPEVGWHRPPRSISIEFCLSTRRLRCADSTPLPYRIGIGKLSCKGERKAGGAGGTRTLYLFNAIEALSRLSYSPTNKVVVVGALSRLSFSPKERTRAGALFQYSKRAVRPQLLKVAL